MDGVGSVAGTPVDLSILEVLHHAAIAYGTFAGSGVAKESPFPTICGICVADRSADNVRAGGGVPVDISALEVLDDAFGQEQFIGGWIAEPPTLSTVIAKLRQDRTMNRMRTGGGVPVDLAMFEVLDGSASSGSFVGGREAKVAVGAGDCLILSKSCPVQPMGPVGFAPVDPAILEDLVGAAGHWHLRGGRHSQLTIRSVETQILEKYRTVHVIGAEGLVPVDSSTLKDLIDTTRRGDLGARGRA